MVADNAYLRAYSVPTEPSQAEHLTAEDAGLGNIIILPEDLGTKFDVDKADLTLLPFRPLLETAQVLMHGEKKYARGNWRKGIQHKPVV